MRVIAEEWQWTCMCAHMGKDFKMCAHLVSNLAMHISQSQDTNVIYDHEATTTRSAIHRTALHAHGACSW